MGNTRPVIAMLLATILACGLFAGCSGGQGGQSTPASPSGTGESSQEPTSDPETIVFAGFPGQEATYDEIAAAFEAESGIHVQVNILPRTGYREALLGPLSSGSGEFDAIYIQNNWIGEFAEAGFLAPLDDLFSADALAAIQADNFPDMVTGSRYNDQCWGLPWDLSTFYLFYRTDLIDTPPATMDEYLDLAKQFTKEHNPDSPTNYGTVLQGSTERVNYQEWYSFLWSFGGDMFDAAGNPSLYSPEAVAALEYRYGMKTDHGVVPPDVDNYAYPEVLSAFQEGVVPMVLQWNAAYTTFADPEASPNIYDRFDAAVLPSQDGRAVPFVKCWYLSVNGFSEQKEAAARFIDFFCGYEGSMISLRNGAAPGSVSAWNDPEILPLRDDTSLFNQSMQMGRMVSNIPEMPAIETELGTALSQVLAKQKTAEEALQQVDEAATKILVQSGRLS